MRKIINTVAFCGLSIVSIAQQADIVNESSIGIKNVDSSSGDVTYSSMTQLPEFPGGQEALMQYLFQNVRYPAKAKRKEIKGRVVVKFVVCQDGSLCNEEVVKGIGGGCDEEVIRVVKAMPKWKPGQHNGQPIRVYYTLPVTFSLADEKQEKK